MKPARVRPSTSSRQVARHAVREHIAQMVLTQQYLPGEKLVQQDLAKRLGVSRGVVREALFELKGMGLIDTRDHRGGTVSPQCGRFLIEALELREMLEGLAARRCCDQITPVQIEALTAMAHEINRLWLSDQGQEGALLDRQFHLTLTEISGNSLQVRMSQNFWFLTKLFRSKARPDLERMLRQHLNIMEAIARRDHDAAEAAMREHIRATLASTEETLKLASGQFDWLVDPWEEALKSTAVSPPVPLPAAE